jgi:hypothetical protein
LREPAWREQVAADFRLPESLSVHATDAARAPVPRPGDPATGNHKGVPFALRPCEAPCRNGQPGAALQPGCESRQEPISDAHP